MSGLNGYGVIKERVNNLIREVRESNTQQNSRMEKLEQMFQQHILWSQEIVRKYESRMVQLEFKHRGFLGGHGSLASVLNFLRRG